MRGLVDVAAWREEAASNAFAVRHVPAPSTIRQMSRSVPDSFALQLKAVAGHPDDRLAFHVLRVCGSDDSGVRAYSIWEWVSRECALTTVDCEWAHGNGRNGS